MSDIDANPRPCVLILGGYGSFGARVARRLARGGLVDIIIAGRSEASARQMAQVLARAGNANVTHAVLDAVHPDRATLERLQPAVIINASGPFQEQDTSLPRLAIELGIHCVDLADSRAYVAGVTALDAAAREKGVLIVSGASTVPGLSSAVADHFLPQFRRLESIDYGITPGNGTEQGIATVRSVLGTLGKPLQTLRARTQVRVHGWQDLGREHYPELGWCWMGLCDIPDLELFPRRYPDLAMLRFRAGAELGVAHLGLWLLSWPARIGVIPKPERLAAPLHWLRQKFTRFGSDRGGMHMKLSGIDHEGRPMHRAWYLIAHSGHGPEIPTIAAVLVARKLATGGLGERGARACMGLFTLAEFLAEAADLDLTVHELTETLYRRVLKQKTGVLPAAVQRLHEPQGTRVFEGRADVEAGRNPIARLLARLLSLPRPGSGLPLTVTFIPNGTGEHWVRRFGDRTFPSYQWQTRATIRERVGPVVLEFAPVALADGMRLDAVSARAFGVPLPRYLAPQILTFESETPEGRYRFSAEARLPFIGRLVRYTGTLTPASDT